MLGLNAPAAHYAPVPQRRSSATKRRRDVFFGLLGVMAGSLLLGLIPPFRFLFVVHVVADLAFAGYIGALVYLRNIAAERDMKVRFLPEPASVEPALALHSSAN
ncbi:MAG: hypothetical protein ACR2H3_09795 [Acidimicrobiales bacterium]